MKCDRCNNEKYFKESLILSKFIYKNKEIEVLAPVWVCRVCKLTLGADKEQMDKVREAAKEKYEQMIQEED